LAEGDAIEFPDFFKDNMTAEGKNASEYKMMLKQIERDRQKNWNKQDLPQ